ncbi:hypothetical protein GOM96_18320 [Stutzerimonas degradans]|nr:hypothetical protein GOM96_18320 [Stutzerimonas degradans]
MQPEKSLKDHVKNGTEDDLKAALEEMHTRFLDISNWITKNRDRTNENLVVFNLFSSAMQYLRVLNISIKEHISILSLATRSLYELNLTIRLILKDSNNFNSWCSEAITDKIQMLEGLLGIQTVSSMSEQRNILQVEIERLKTLRDKHQLPTIKSPAPAGQIAQQIGLSEEHKNLYKLFSKVVHPSSYLVNDYKNAASIETRIILQTHAQLYAWDTFSRVCEYFNVPGELRENATHN